MARIKSHPLMTPERIAASEALAEKIDRDEKDQIIAQAKEFFARRERMKAAIDRLKAARIERNLTLEQISAKTGIGTVNLSRLENDSAPNPTLELLVRVAEAIGVQVLI